jgi:hypothetical protein
VRERVAAKAVRPGLAVEAYAGSEAAGIAEIFVEL